jgi:hypothetical protein
MNVFISDTKGNTMEFEPVIGLEVHAQLKTSTKIFCGCSTAFGAPPNTHTCPVCLGMPGVLPVLNRKVVDYTLRMAVATHCEINPEVDCAWQMIYDRLITMDKLDALLEIQPPKDWRTSRDGGPRKIVRDDLRLTDEEE